MESKKKLQPIFPKLGSLHASPFDLGDFDFIAFLNRYMIGHDASNMVGKRLHLFEPS